MTKAELLRKVPWYATAVNGVRTEAGAKAKSGISIDKSCLLMIEVVL